MRLFDTHCHLASPELFPLASGLIESGREREVNGFAIISADFESLRLSQELCTKLKAQFPQTHIVRSAGIHPHDAKTLDEAGYLELEESFKGASAIGETGLDYHYEHSDRALQKKSFDWHIEKACQLKKPLIIHCRESVADILSMLKRPSILAHSNPGIIHCFSENEDSARKFLDLNFHVSFSGILTFKNAERLRSIVKWVPLERLLIETDAPWLAPAPFRGKQNQPAYVSEVFKTLVSQRLEPADQIAEQLWKNSCHVFSLGEP